MSVSSVDSDSRSLVLRLRHVFPLRVEALVGVGGVVDDVELAVLVVVAVPPVDHAVVVPLLVPELPVVPVVRSHLSYGAQSNVFREK